MQRKNSAGYSKKSLSEKLGVKKEGVSVVIHPPPDFKLDGVKFKKTLEDSSDFIHLFTKSKRELREYFPKLKKNLKLNGILCISWPKKSSHVSTDVDENIIREIGLENGLVDVKVAAIDETWSGLKFVFRLKDRYH